MQPDHWSLYTLMLRSRLFEEAVSKLWHDGLISGEMHLGTGEEAVNAGIVAHLQEGDALALDHRGTAPLLMRGVDPVLILRELLGRSDGLCGGMGGHMHLFSREHLVASSGIVGAAGPTAAGFALAAQYTETGCIAVAFFGEGAMNQGMLMESMNLAAAWRLPVLFVCKNDDWSITTQSERVTGGDLNERARGLGLRVFEVDGQDVSGVFAAAQDAIEHVRSGRGPTFLHARCVHLEGHYLGFQLLKIGRDPLKEMPKLAGPIAQSILHTGGSSMRERMEGLRTVVSSVISTMRDAREDTTNDPILRARVHLESESERLRDLEERIELETTQTIASALIEEPS